MFHAVFQWQKKTGLTFWTYFLIVSLFIVKINNTLTKINKTNYCYCNRFAVIMDTVYLRTYICILDFLTRFRMYCMPCKSLTLLWNTLHRSHIISKYLPPFLIKILRIYDWANYKCWWEKLKQSVIILHIKQGVDRISNRLIINYIYWIGSRTSDVVR